MVKQLDCRIVVSEFKLQLRNYFPFWTITLGKGMDQPTKADVPINKRNQRNQTTMDQRGPESNGNKEYIIFHKAPGLEPLHQMQFSVIFRTLIARGCLDRLPNQG